MRKPRAFRPDATWRRVGADRRIVLAGSPLRLFRFTAAGAEMLDAIESGAAVDDSSLVRRLVDSGAIHPVPTPPPSYKPGDVTIVTPQLGGRVADDERITVDDGSMPPVAGATIRLHQNQGPAAARNAGRTAVNTSLVAFVDSDVDLGAMDEWLLPLLGHFDDPRVGLVAPRVIGEAHSPLDLGEELARIRAGTRVSYVPTAAIVMRTDAFDDIGGFDERLRFGEDVDAVWRLDDAGWTCRYEPAARVHHRPRATFVGRLRQHGGYGTSVAPLALRHTRRLAPIRMNRWNLAAWSSLAVGHPVVAAVAAIAGAANVRRQLPDVPNADVARLNVRSQIENGRQITAAVRRVWWPIVALLSIVSKRARLVGLAALLASPSTAADDLAYGVGVWRGVFRHRSGAGLRPDIT